VPLTLFALCFAGLLAYRHAMYDPRYFVDMGNRIVWHNALMGLGSNAEIARMYKLDVNDAHVVQSVIDYLRSKHDPRLTPAWTISNILGSFGGHSESNWQTYEAAARDLYLSICYYHFRDVLHAYLIDKPFEAANVLRQSVSDDATITRRMMSLYFEPFALGGTIIVAPGLALAAWRRLRFGRYLPPLALLAVLSLLPGLMFYAVVVTMAGTFLTLALIAYVIAAAVCSAAPDAAITMVRRFTNWRVVAADAQHAK